MPLCAEVCEKLKDPVLLHPSLQLWDNTLEIVIVMMIGTKNTCHHSNPSDGLKYKLPTILNDLFIFSMRKRSYSHITQSEQ